MDWGQCFGASDSRLLCSGNAGLWTAIQADVDKDDLQFLLSLKARMLLHNAAQFERRVTGTLRQYPFKLLWLVFTPADEPCDIRKHIAKEILETEKGNLEINARKLLHLFPHEFQIAAQSGILPSQQLYWMLWASSLIWKSDVRANEGLNKYISLLDERSPNASVDLKSSRLSLRYLLGEHGFGKGASRCKWSLFKPVAEKVREQCLKCWDDVVGVQANPFRWKPNEAAQGLLQPDVLIKEYVKLRPRLNCSTVRYAWAASYNMVVHKNLNPTGVDPVVLVIGVRRNGRKTSFDFYVSAEVVRRKHIVCHATALATVGDRQVTIRKLQGFSPFVKLIEAQYDNVSAGHTVTVMQAFGKVVQNQTVTNDPDCTPVVTVLADCRLVSLVRLQKPTASFLKRCQGNSNSKSAKVVHHGDPSHSDGPEVDHRVDDEQHTKEQELGLNLLAEEAEANDSGTSGDANDQNNDEVTGDDDVVDGDFHCYVAQGLASSFHPNVFNDDEALEREASSWMGEMTHEDLVANHDKAVALQAMNSKACNLENPSSQMSIESVQAQLNMDAVDAAVETAFAAASGLPAEDQQPTEDIEGP